MKKMNKKAFTLIELLIVIAIIGILFIVLVSKVDFATDKAKATGVQTDFRSFQMAFEQVAKENAGFTTFGWDTGDNGASGTIPAGYTYANAKKDAGDGIRNSYDKGDKNLNGIKEEAGDTYVDADGNTQTVAADEVWTGAKIYTEEWSGVWTLVKPVASGAAATTYDADRIFALESAINKNLDPKLHITIGTDGKITMANQARDPWKVEYEGVLLCNAETTGKAVANPDSDAADKLDRGAIVMYSKGANGKLGSIAKVDDGVVTVTVSTVNANTLDNNVAGKDDYSFSTIYTFKNGYGEVISATTGFSSNQ
jgi:prepilin-type N-terminal cleavage/methylation domain-containing protein